MITKAIKYAFKLQLISVFVLFCIISVAVITIEGTDSFSNSIVRGLFSSIKFVIILFILNRVDFLKNSSINVLKNNLFEYGPKSLQRFNYYFIAFLIFILGSFAYFTGSGSIALKNLVVLLITVVQLNSQILGSYVKIFKLIKKEKKYPLLKKWKPNSSL